MSDGRAFASVEIADPYLELRVNAAHEQLYVTFKTAKDVATWAQNEHSIWQDKRNNAVAVLKKNGFPNIDFGGPFFEQFNELAQAARDDASQGRDSPSDRLRGACGDLTRAIVEGDAVASESTIGQRLIEMEKDSPLEFAIAMAMTQRGGASLSLHSTNRSQTEFPVRVIFDAYRARYPARISEIDPQSIIFGERIIQLDHFLKRASDGLREIEQLQQTLRQKVATEQAVKIWKQRANDHNDRQKLLLGGVFATFIVLGVLIFIELSEMLPGGRLSDIATVLKADAWLHFVLLGIPILAGIWIIRMLTVLYRVDVAGAQDAGERVAMVETLYALHAEGKTAPNEAERMLVMAALFRPGPGADHDPSLPNTVVEQIARVAVREQGKQ